MSQQIENINRHKLIIKLLIINEFINIILIIQIEIFELKIKYRLH